MKNIYIICSSLNIEELKCNLFGSQTNFLRGFNVNFVVLKNSTMLSNFISKDVKLIEYKCTQVTSIKI